VEGVLGNLDPNREHDITIQEVLTCDVFSHFSEEQALEVIETLKQFAVIVYNFHQAEK
jgi:hypothetical protein